MNKLIVFGITLMMVSACFILVPDSAEAGVFTDLSGPDATFRDIEWHEEGDYAMVVGNDSAGGVTYRYQANDESWTPLESIPGDSYNAVDQTEPYVYIDDMEEDAHLWTSSTWGEEENDLIGHWKLDDGIGTNVNDTSGNNNDGTLLNGDTGTCWVDGMDDKAINFNNPSDYVEVTNVANLTSGSFSGQCWVNFTSHQSFGGIVNKYDVGAANEGWGIWDQTDGDIRFYMVDDVGGSTSQDSSVVSIGEWHHIAWVYNGTSEFLNFYIDGEEDYSVPCVNPSRDYDLLTIGKYHTYELDARIDDVRVYDRVLSHSEIYDYYNMTYNKVGEWKFDEGTGSLAKDSSQHYNNGTLVFMGDADRVDGIYKDALKFDGSNKYVDCGNDASLNLPKTFTIESWIKLSSVGDYNTVVSKAIDNNLAEISYAYLTDTANHLLIYISDGASAETHISLTSLAVDTWNHIAVVATDTEFIFYLNGQEDGVFGGHVIAPQIIAANVRIGTKTMTPTQYFDGAIDEVNIWNYSLSASDILNNYNRAVNNYYENSTLGGEWNFEDGFGTTATDSGIYGNDGSLVNMEDIDWVDGISGKALVFDGLDEVVQIPDNDFWDLDGASNSDDFTISQWINIEDYKNAQIFHQQNGAVYWYLEVRADNTIELYSTLGGGSPIGTWGWTPSTGIWYHLAITKSGVNYECFINGESIGLQTSAISFPNVAAPLRIGASLGNFFNGTIDEVKIWKRNLNATEIMESYQSVLVPSWHILDPSTLPTPGSGVPHGTANSGNSVGWYGIEETGNYDNGEKTHGSVVSQVTYLPGTSNFGLVVFSHWFDVESIGPNADIMSVSIKNTTDLSWTTLKTWDSDSAPVSSWYQEWIRIDGWLGNYVQINFTFNSVDGELNDYAGWHLDDYALYVGGLDIVVGESPTLAGSSVYAMDIGGFSNEITGVNAISFNGVAAGSTGATFLAVGDSGAARYWNNSAWFALTGIDPLDTLTSVDSNGSHFFIVGYDSGGLGASYYITQNELDNGFYAVHKILGTPDIKLNDISWNNNASIGLVAGEGGAYGLMDPEIWSNETSTVAPSQRDGSAMAFDSNNHVIILFGGIDEVGNNDETWAYDTNTNVWTNMSPVSKPTARRYHSMVYDEESQVIVLYGGYPYSAETWTYDYGTNTWTNMNPASPPTARCYHSMVYDSENSKTIMFGGLTSAETKQDTWTYHVGTNTWTNKNPASPPTARSNFGMTYDSNEKKVVLFGGNAGGYNGETWVYEPGLNTWTNMNPVPSPTARCYHSMVYNPDENVVFMFGGRDGVDDDESWTYDVGTNTWTDLFPATRPSPRSYFTMAYDSDYRQIILFGGNTGSYNNETWLCELEGSWGNAGGTIVTENYTAVAWDPTGERAIIVGNSGTDSFVYDYYGGKNYISKIPDKQNTFQSHQLYGAAYQPLDRINAEVLLVGASAFKIIPNEIDQGTRITANSVTPNLFWIGFNNTLSNSMLEQQVPPDEWYQFEFAANYSQGWLNTEIIVQAWYDNGAVGVASAYPAETDDNRCLAFTLYYDPSGPTYTMSYPGNPEHTIGVATDIVIGGVGPDEIHYVTLPIFLGAQTRNADGNGFVSGDPDTDPLANIALMDPNSWDFNITVRDSTFTSANETMYSEFGIEKLVAVTVAGNPSGNTPPGSSNILLSNPSQITYSANAEYWVNVSIPNLLENGVGPASIAATFVEVQNADPNATALNSEISAQIAIAGAGTGMSVWGVGGTSLPAPSNGTIACGEWVTDYNAGGLDDYTILNWWITVPGATPEGVYWATITITIES